VVRFGTDASADDRRTVAAARSAGAEVTPIDLRALVHPRQILQTLNMLVITEQFALP
jgi:hypothetical protein